MTGTIEPPLLERITEEVRTYFRLGLLPNSMEDLSSIWQARIDGNSNSVVRDDQTIDHDALANFQRLMVLVPEIPVGNVSDFSFRNLVGGSHRGSRQLLRDTLTIIQENGYEPLLRSHPCSTIGNPRLFKHQGFRYNFRWLKHTYFAGLLNKILGERLEDDFVALDIGSSYGVFSALVKGQHPASHHVLVDFPDQLILAYYFLSAYLPEAKVAGISQVSEQGALTREFIENYDFVLVPSDFYQRLEPATVDVVSNFTSFAEMHRNWFDHYVSAPAFLTGKYFFTSNRVESYPDDDTDLTILDYPVWDTGKRLHFRICPLWPTHYRRRRLFFYEGVAHSPHFEYIGAI